MIVDPAVELARLKDFQRASAHYVFRRMYTGDDPAHRVLIADEVGLGKTMVARGVIALAIDHLLETTERVDILYVCSNLEIARQNVNRLNVLGDDDVALSGRVTLLPIQHHDLSARRVNIISFTPGTSFDLKSGTGTRQERAVLRMMLRAAWGEEHFRSAGSFRIFQKPVRSYEKFKARALEVQKAHAKRLDGELVQRFRDALDAEDAGRSQRGEATLWEEFNELCDLLRRQPSPEPRDVIHRRTSFVGTTRRLLARACIDLLEPDLIILDEFQRFRELLDWSDNPSPAAELAQELFAYTDSETGEAARLLLLSATPYKMLTLKGVDGDDDHYSDFIRTVGFLLHDEDATKQFEHDLRQFRAGLLQAESDGGAAALSAKARIEATLRQVMVRTERLAVGTDRDGMLQERTLDGVSLTPEDVHAYAAASQLSRSVESWDPLEVWKSAPYLFSFLDGYQLASNVEKALEDPMRAHDIGSHLESGGLVPLDAIEQYEQIDPGNARLRGLAADTLDREMWRLLWVPPSLPYHEPTGVWKYAAKESLTKRLVFSAWQIAPKAIGAVLSYDAERRMMTAHGAPRSTNTTSGRSRLGQRLDFSYSTERLTGMPHLALLYPSPLLSAIGDPLTVARDWMAEYNRLPTNTELRAEVEAAIQELLDELKSHAGVAGTADQRWYWAAPILLDWEHDEDAANEYWSAASPRDWRGDERVTNADRFGEHLREARNWFFDPKQLSENQLGPMPDDLASVLARLAIGGPANCALRAITRVAPFEDGLHDPHARAAAARASWGVRSLFNAPEVSELVRAGTDRTAYWQQVLDYCIDGDLQAVLDEHCHVLIAALGLVAKEPSEVAERLGEALHDTSALRSVSVSLSDLAVEDGLALRTGDRPSMRHSFAQRLSAGRDTDDQGTRPQELRAAFNSPFWPWVLASTSIGQEGLDFHLWCHAVVHWNLPSNPVDMEQREGRVHRFQGHALRKNIAAKCGTTAFTSDEPDPWAVLFDEAAKLRPPDTSEIVPYWVFGDGDHPARIERIVPTLPLSRDVRKYHDLKRTLAAYRLAFGQPRQTELLEYLVGLDDELLAKLGDQLRIDLRPPALAAD